VTEGESMKWLGYDGNIMGIMEYHGWLLVGGFNPYPSEKYESVGMMTFPIYGKIKNCSKPPTRISWGYDRFMIHYNVVHPTHTICVCWL